MPFKFSEDERAAFEKDLRAILVAASLWLGGPAETSKGRCREDAIQQVMLEIHEFLCGRARLRPFTRHNRPVETSDDLKAYARWRLKTVHASNARAAQREAQCAVNRPVDVLAAAAQPEPIEHDIYDQRFLEDALSHLAKDDIAYRYATLMINCHVLAGTEDLDPCDNQAIARILNCEPSDVRNARNRIQTVKNRLLAARTEDRDR